MPIRGVLLDYSGTLFRLIDHEHWFADAQLREQVAAPAELMRRMTATVATAETLPPEWQGLWDRRDLEPDSHRKVYSEILRRAGLPDDAATAIYAGLTSPRFWEPYPDTAAALRLLRDADIPVAVVSNIAWDIRAVFERAGLTELVREFVLSYVEGSIKPEPHIFRVACERLGIEPADALMIGDSETADGGIVQLGARVAIVDPLPVRERPRALLDALAAHDIG